ncbi:lytic transglycosylase domain-containing protein [Siccirubricoccus sp. G192]|uniref:lytic transglycosylase domain-containing protein n=1 Tax=Siccirubricoccus sp. G192 TaxID=2849651 RepID=UPI0035C844D2
MRVLCPVLILVLLSACSGRPGGYGTGWDGRRGYDGNGDYGYDLAASRAAAATYRAHAARSYPAPGRPEDPWRPYISEAAARHAVPERWIREVMRQESGGRLFAADGSLITSRAGAMGLMQVMPRTYDTLRRRHGLGDDPYEPRDNILAGAAYIREMYDRFGAPHFLAAYNAGPERVEAYRKRGVEARLPAGWVDVLVRRGAWSFGPTLWSTLTMTRRTAAIGV